jgi:serine/threonine protein kinase
MLAGYPPFYDDNPMGIYKKIIEGQYEIPVVIPPNARDLIQRFLKADCRIRLGCTNVLLMFECREV